MANEAVVADPRFAVTYQPGVGAPASGWNVGFTVGKSCGRQRIHVWADRPSGPVASSTAAWSSASPTAFDSDALGAVAVGCTIRTIRTVPPATAAAVIVTLLVPAAQRSV